MPTQETPPTLDDLLNRMPADLRAEIIKYKEEYKATAIKSGMRDVAITMCLTEFIRGAAYTYEFLNKQQTP